MKKIKSQKGITLVALIITIVVLLILAMVAIGTLQESKIIGHAQNAAGGYNQEKNIEEEMLGNYVNIIEENLPKEDAKGISIDDIINKAYTADFEGDRMLVYHFTKEDGKTYLNARVYNKTTGEDVSNEHGGAGQKMEIRMTNEFDEKINIIVNGSNYTISNQNAIFMQGLNGYITLDGLYVNIEDGKSYTAPNSEKILIRNSSYDSKISE